MGQEFEDLDLRGAEFWAVDLRGARFCDVDLSGARIERSRLTDVEIDAEIDRIVINGVDVTDHVNANDPWYPLRTLIRPDGPDGLVEGWKLLEEEWNTTIGEATALPPELIRESVNGEWSFLQTLRHLVFAIDKWFFVPILGAATFESIGLPNTGSIHSPWPGLDLEADPTLDEVLAVRAEQHRRFAETLAGLTPAHLEGEIDVPENGTMPRSEGYSVPLEEGFQHLRYARRDLAQLS